MLPDGGRRELTARYALVDTRHPRYVRVTPREGWHPPERGPGGGEWWQWTAGEATLQLVNPRDVPLAIDTVVDGWSAVPRRLSLVRAGGEERPWIQVRTERAPLRLPVLGVPPGESTLRLRTPEPPFFAPGDPRPLGVAVFRFQVTPRP